MTDKSVADFIDAAIKREDALEYGNAKIANKKYAEMEKIRKQWMKDPDRLLELLEPLLNHENDAVRLHAAFTLLRIIPERCEGVMEEIASKDGEVAFEAEMTLREWKNGRLKFTF